MGLRSRNTVVVEAMILLLLCRNAVGQDETRQCSLYMRELDQFVSRAANTYLTQFICTDFIVHRLYTVATLFSTAYGRPMIRFHCMVCQTVSLFIACAVQKQLNGLRFHSGKRFLGAQGPLC